MTAPLSHAFLEGLYRTHHRLENLAPDPLVFARGYPDPADGEIAGLVAASFAYGRVHKIMETLAQVFGLLQPCPSASILSMSSDEISSRLGAFSYRFHKTKDVVLFFHLLRRALERWGSLRGVFAAAGVGKDTAGAIAGFCDAILGGDARPVLGASEVPAGHPVRFLLASPGRGGAAKRLCLFLRWMVRRDAIDPGYWQGLMPPGCLIIPLDTHVARVSRELGLTKRAAADWRTACEITEGLRRFDPDDPVRFDFSLFRYGMGGAPATERGG